MKHKVLFALGLSQPTGLSAGMGVMALSLLQA